MLIRCLAVWFTLTHAVAALTGANGLTHLDDPDPFHPHLTFPKLITPQWVAKTNVEAVVVLAIDDMGPNTAPYEHYLRPVIERLKRIDGRAPISIFCNAVTPTNAQIQTWIKEGLSMEVHTLTHPCPILAKNDFKTAHNTFHGGVDLLNQIPGNRPVAFRTPCCDSINSPSPRLYAEIFNRTNAAGQFLEIDSSVMVALTSKDPALPRSLTLDDQGRDRFLRYLPFPAFSTTIENYPYPYVLGQLCWEFPAMVPSDWEAQNIQGQTNPITLKDWKLALDATVIKQGTLSFIFHPHNKWSSSEQFVDFIDYAVSRYGEKVLFLNFKEALDRLNNSLLDGQSLRSKSGADNGVRLADLDGDGFLDVMIGNDEVRRTKMWDPINRTWDTTEFPTSFVESNSSGRVQSSGTRLGIVSPSGTLTPLMMTRNEKYSGAWIFEKSRWKPAPEFLEGLVTDGRPALFSSGGVDLGARFRDFDHKGACELILANPSIHDAFEWQPISKSWRPASKGSFPSELAIVDAEGMDNGVRFVDINADGFEDLLVSNQEGFSLHLYVPELVLGWSPGWTREVFRGSRGGTWEIPAFVRGGSFRNNGAWFRNQHLWVQNENTAHLPDLVDRRSFAELLRGPLPKLLSPEESLSKIRIQDDLSIELVACEPLIQSPVAMDWDAKGRLWVVENRDYPLGSSTNGHPSSVIKILEDQDGDGRYDKATEFLGGLNFANGLLHWKNGLLISAAPHVLFAEDSDGDDKADKTTILFEGFKEGNPQHRVNGFEYGLDNWIYGANGDSGGMIRRGHGQGPVVAISGRDFRFRPGTGEFQTQAGMTQFGRHRDDWGNWFGNNNATMAYHFPFPEHYLARNPSLVFKSMRQFLGQEPDGGRIFPISTPYQRFNLVGAADRYTSANSPTPYRDSLLGAGFTNALFVSEPVNNLIHRELLEPDGVTFRSHRAETEAQSEFVASSDPWFRPVQIKTGPDGALYFVDMYRLILEHPEWIPDDVERVLDLRAGATSGRIYRIRPKNKTLRKIPNLENAASSDLVGLLESDNGWTRDHAQRLLIDRMSDPISQSRTIPLLRGLVRQGIKPLGRLHAFCTLEGSGGLSIADLLVGLKDAHPGVREHAVRMAEPFLQTPHASSPLWQQLVALADDPEIRVRYQLAFSLGEGPGSTESAEVLARIAISHPDSAHIQGAVLSASSKMPEKILRHLFASESNLDRIEETVTHLTALAHATLSPQDRSAMVLKIVEHGRHEITTLNLNTLTTLKFDFGAETGLTKDSLNEWRKSLRKILGEPTQPYAKTAAAIRLLGRDRDRDADTETSIVSRLDVVASPEIQDAVIQVMAGRPSLQAWSFILMKLPHLTPQTARKILDQTFRRKETILALVTLLERGSIRPESMSTGTRAFLTGHPEKEIQDRARVLFGNSSNDSRKSLVRRAVTDVDRLEGNSSNGAGVFAKHCSLCHAFMEAANASRSNTNPFGPNLASLVDKSSLILMTSILDPNEAVEDRYKAFTVTLTDGDEITGLILEESANSITLGTINGNKRVVTRKQITGMHGGMVSLMPEGFESALTSQDSADLLSFLRSAPSIAKPNP